MQFSTFVDYAVAYWLDCLKTGKPLRTLCLLGPPGIGKSAAAEEIVERMTMIVRKDPSLVYHGATPPPSNEIVGACHLMDFTSKLPEDLSGLPWRTEDEAGNSYTEYCPQRWVADLCGPHSFGVYVQDDITQAGKNMQVAGRQSALERRIHEHRFAPGVLVLVTGNRREDKAAAGTLPSHFINSITMLSIEPSLKDWTKWYGSQPGLDPMIANFLRWKQELLSQSPSHADKQGRFATPRQWAALGAQYATAHAMNLLNEVSMGLVGEAAGVTFCSFVDIYSQLVDPELVFDNPKGVLPNPREKLTDPSKVIAMVTALGVIGARRSRSSKTSEKSEAPEKLMRALSWVTSGKNEHCATGVYTFLDNKGNLTELARVAREHRDDKELGGLLTHLKSALLRPSQQDK